MYIYHQLSNNTSLWMRRYLFQFEFIVLSALSYAHITSCTVHTKISSTTPHIACLSCPPFLCFLLLFIHAWGMSENISASLAWHSALSVISMPESILFSRTIKMHSHKHIHRSTSLSFVQFFIIYMLFLHIPIMNWFRYSLIYVKTEDKRIFIVLYNIYLILTSFGFIYFFFFGIYSHHGFRSHHRTDALVSSEC